MNRFIAILTPLVMLIGCQRMVIEKKSLFVSVPPGSNEAHLYYTFQGISLVDKDNWAMSDIDALRKEQFIFFSVDSRNELMKTCQFEELRFFLDPSRKRQLCADRRVTIRDRAEFAAIFNRTVSGGIREHFRNSRLDERAVREAIESWQVVLDSWKEFVEIGVVPIYLYQMIEGMLRILEKFNDASLSRLVDALQGDFAWLRFESDSMQIVLPTTADCGQRILSDPMTIEWLNMLRVTFNPVDLQLCDDGVAIVFGFQGKLIHIEYEDNHRYAASGETRIAQLAGNPGPIIVDGKAETVESLIQRFVLERTGYRVWHDATGKYSATAKYEGFIGGKVVLLKEDGSNVSLTREQLGIADRDYIDSLAN